MSGLAIAGIVIGAIVLLFVLLNIIHILQAGRRVPDGRTMAQILGKDPATATFDDIERLSRKEKMQLFYAAPAPTMEELSGEYEARLLSGGALGKSTELFTHHSFPTGGIRLNTKWVGKAFRYERGGLGSGYNIFEEKGNGATRILRIRPIDTRLATSRIAKDHSKSFIIDYSKRNRGTIHSMRDEVRKIHDTLYIGAGYMGLGGGPVNPAPFAIIGKSKPWVGTDR